MERRHTTGLTLVELLITLSILVLVVTMGMPAMASFIQQGRLRAAAQDAATLLALARTETLSSPDPVQAIHVSFYGGADNDASWCIGLKRGTTCDCRITDMADTDTCSVTTGDIRTRRVVSHHDYPGIRLQDIAFGAGNATHFNAVRGTARAGHLTFSGTETLKIILSPLGRVRQCVPEGSRVSGVRPC